ncbi:dihydrofolate reductase family protein [Agrococcus sp. SL85]|uniref:dihydrofolate reductase family protein n=1 Tax=Agrococcus sp. SL85 TaxID=2995141 RepID=UPI00226C818E|nr:dihydrofolate reductase family protein [Agrococcus sp. SL85]WAC67166.1 dihydrofolate reductase family protein [Agrococcus sp. SL85]
MRLVAHEFMTLDGVMQGPGGSEEDTSGGFRHGGWVAPAFDDTVGEVVTGWFARTDALLFGRTTYDMMAAYWPLVTDPDDPVAQRLNTAPKHVVSTTLDPAEAPWQGTASVIADDVVARIRALKDGGEGELQVHGSWQLLQTLIDERLLDELRLIVFPVVVGRGKRLFDDVARPSGFDVSDVRVAESGAVAMVLVPSPFRIATYEVVDGAEVMVEDPAG